MNSVIYLQFVSDDQIESILLCYCLDLIPFHLDGLEFCVLFLMTILMMVNQTWTLSLSGVGVGVWCWCLDSCCLLSLSCHTQRAHAQQVRVYLSEFRGTGTLSGSNLELTDRVTNLRDNYCFFFSRGQPQGHDFMRVNSLKLKHSTTHSIGEFRYILFYIYFILLQQVI